MDGIIFSSFEKVFSSFKGNLNYENLFRNRNEILIGNNEEGKVQSKIHLNHEIFFLPFILPRVFPNFKVGLHMFIIVSL